MPTPDVAATLRYETLVDRYRLAAAAFLAALWASLERYGDEAEEEFAVTAAPRLDGFKRTTVSVSAAYFATVLGVRPVGIDPARVLSRPRLRDPFLAARHAVSEGRMWDEAYQAGRSMAEAVGFNFVQSTARRTGDVVAEESGLEVVGWRRVPSAAACPWCHLIATQLYRSSESADFGHDRCDCNAVPVTVLADPGRTLNEQRAA